MKRLIYVGIFFLQCLLLHGNSIPRPEYPRPQFERVDWINLNGEWSYEFDFGKSGMDRNLYASKGFSKKIIVPFCPESELSGVHYIDFIPAMWYHRAIQCPMSWKGKHIYLHFGAVDYFCAVYVDGQLVGRHWGGSSSFKFDITPFVADGKTHDLVVRVEDDVRSGLQTCGKQSTSFGSQGCFYTRTTGIWQTVWMECVSPFGLKECRILPDFDQKSFVLQPEFYALKKGMKLQVLLKEKNRVVVKKTMLASTFMTVMLPVANPKTWTPEAPFLYDIEMLVIDEDGTVMDKVFSYAGMRKIHIEGNRLFLNNKPYYLRLVLDQGFYPKGIWTAPSDADLKRDIELGLAAGFNGARLHQKVFEERFHYWADKLGYLTWGESASWGIDMNSPEAARNFLTEWEEIIVRDRNHPSIIVWTPFNETWGRPDDNEAARQHDRLISDVYNLSHHLDYRPVNDASGNYHVKTDLWSVHHYAQSGPEMIKRLTLVNGQLPQKDVKKEVKYGGQPYFLDEYGGIKWVVGKEYAENTWGYGNGPKTEEEFYNRLMEVTNVVLQTPFIAGYCYTQLTDVEQEQNGIYNYDRTPKFNMKRISQIFSQKPY